MSFGKFEEFVSNVEFGKNIRVDWEKTKEIKNDYYYSYFLKYLKKLDILSKKSEGNYCVLSKEEKNLNPGKFYFVRWKDAKKFMEAFDNSARVVWYHLGALEEAKPEAEEINELTEEISNAKKDLEERTKDSAIKKDNENPEVSAEAVQYPLEIVEAPKPEVKEENKLNDTKKNLEKETQYNSTNCKEIIEIKEKNKEEYQGIANIPIDWKAIRDINEEKKFRETITPLIHAGILSSEQSKNYEIFSKDGRSLNPQGIYFKIERHAEDYRGSLGIPTDLIHHPPRFTGENLEQRTKKEVSEERIEETSLKQEKRTKKRMSFKKKSLLTIALSLGLVYGAEKTGIIADRYFLESLPERAPVFLLNNIIDPIYKQISPLYEKISGDINGGEKKKTAVERERQRMLDVDTAAKFQDTRMWYKQELENQREQEATIARQRETDAETEKVNEEERIKEEKRDKQEKSTEIMWEVKTLLMEKQNLDNTNLDEAYKNAPKNEMYKIHTSPIVNRKKEINKRLTELRNEDYNAYEKGEEFYNQDKNLWNH